VRRDEERDGHDARDPASNETIDRALNRCARRHAEGNFHRQLLSSAAIA
jgi:hypothetical protein